MYQNNYYPNPPPTLEQRVANLEGHIYNLNLEQRVKYLEYQINNRNSTLNSDLNKFTNYVDNQFKELFSKTEELEKKDTQIMQVLKSCTDAVSRLRSQNDDLQYKNDQLKRQVDDLKAQLYELRKEIVGQKVETDLSRRRNAEVSQYQTSNSDKFSSGNKFSSGDKFSSSNGTSRSTRILSSNKTSISGAKNSISTGIFIDEYNALFDNDGYDFKTARDAFIEKYGVIGFSCSNYNERQNNPAIAATFTEMPSAKDGEYWAIRVANGNRFAVVPNFKSYNENYHIARAMGEVFNSNFQEGNYKKATLKKAAIFEKTVGEWNLVEKGEMILR